MTDPQVNKVLLVDDSADTRSLLSKFFSLTCPEAEITEYDPIESGKPPAGFNWSDYDLLILDYDLGKGENGLEWLREFKTSTGFPATIILTAKDDEELVVKAQKYGAQGFLRKVGLKKNNLLEAIKSALKVYSSQTQEASSKKLQVHHYNKERFLEQLTKINRDDAVALVKIDGFQEISRSLDNLGTDKFIKFITNMIQVIILEKKLRGKLSRIRESVIGIIIQNCGGIKGAEDFARSLCKRFDYTEYKYDNNKIDFSVSIGLCVIDEEKKGVSGILKSIETAYAEARKIQGNSYSMKGDLPEIDDNHDDEIPDEINEALEEERITPLFQPLVLVSDTGHEIYKELYQVTINMTDSENNVLEPREFLPVLEKRGSLHKLDRWISRHCLIELSKLNSKTDRGYAIFVSLTVQSLKDKELTDWISNVVERLKMPEVGKYLIFSINANDFLSNTRDAKLQFNKLRIKIKSGIALTHVEDMETLDKCLQIEKFNFVFFSPEHTSKGKMDAGLIQQIADKIKEEDAFPVASKIDSGEYLAISASSGADYVAGYFVQPPMEHIVSAEEIVV